LWRGYTFRYLEKNPRRARRRGGGLMLTEAELAAMEALPKVSAQGGFLPFYDAARSFVPRAIETIRMLKAEVASTCGSLGEAFAERDAARAENARFWKLLEDVDFYYGGD